MRVQCVRPSVWAHGDFQIDGRDMFDTDREGNMSATEASLWASSEMAAPVSRSCMRGREGALDELLETDCAWNLEYGHCRRCRHDREYPNDGSRQNRLVCLLYDKPVVLWPMASTSAVGLSRAWSRASKRRAPRSGVSASTLLQSI